MHKHVFWVLLLKAGFTLAWNTTSPEIGGRNYWVFQISIRSQPRLCLDIPGAKSYNGNPLEIWECNGAEGQLWYFDQGANKIQYAGDPSKCIDASDMKPGRRLQLWDCNGQSQQMWGYDVNKGSIYLSASGSNANSCMDLAGGQTTGGTPVQVWNCNSQWGQSWNLMSGITIRAGYDYELCLDIVGGKTDDGTPLQLWSCNGLLNQNWIFESGSSMIKSAADTSKCIDSGSLQAGQHLQLWNCNGLSQQKWGYDASKGRLYLSTTSWCMDIPGGNMKAGQYMWIYGCSGCWNQFFSVVGPANQLPVASVPTYHSNGCPPQPSPSPAPSPGPQGNFISQCQQWGGGLGSSPVFQNAGQLTSTGGWQNYFTKVYGSVPDSRYPICIGSFWFLNRPIFQASGITNPKLIKCPTNAGDYYTSNNKYEPSWASWIWHPPPFGVNGQGIPANTWIEVSHNRQGRESAGMWFMFSMGSGIWFNSGKTGVYSDHGAAQNQFCGGCRGDDGNNKMALSAAKQGYSSVQFLAHPDDQWRCHDHVKVPKGAMNIEIVGVALNGKGPCGPSANSFKAGWNADKACNCDGSKSYLNCQGFGAVVDEEVLI